MNPPKNEVINVFLTQCYLSEDAKTIITCSKLTKHLEVTI